MKKELKIYLASPRGFCAGVKRAIEIVDKSINKYGSPVYVRHEIVHNKQVVEDLKKKGQKILKQTDLFQLQVAKAFGTLPMYGLLLFQVASQKKVGSK